MPRLFSSDGKQMMLVNSQERTDTGPWLPGYSAGLPAAAIPEASMGLAKSAAPPPARRFRSPGTWDREGLPRVFDIPVKPRQRWPVAAHKYADKFRMGKFSREQREVRAMFPQAGPLLRKWGKCTPLIKTFSGRGTFGRGAKTAWIFLLFGKEMLCLKTVQKMNKYSEITGP